MYFSPELPLVVLWLLVAAAVCVLLAAAIYFFRVRTVSAYCRRADRERPDKPDAEYEPASVVVYSQGDAGHLEEILKALLDQDYPAVFEVVVVNEGERSDVSDLVSMLRAKLALTLGVKAARYGVVVLTTTAAVIESRMWLRRMMAPFGASSPVEVVLGFAYVDPAEDKSNGRRRRAFDFVADSVRWLGVAIAGKPFRGTEYNIAYRKEVFFRNSGFARSLNLHHGDDDIFVSQVAGRDNTVVELSRESMVRLRHGNHPRIFTERTLQRHFTESFIRRRPRILYPLAGWLQLAAIICGGMAAIISWPNLQAALVALVIVAVMLTIDIITWRKAQEALRSRRLLLSIPWLAVLYPVRRMVSHIHSLLGRQKKYTWD